MENIQDIAGSVCAEIEKLQKKNDCVLVAVDGRCASGKTTLARGLQKLLDCNVFHTDDFFLRPEQRTKERYEEAGGNMDRERLYEEVVRPIIQGKRVVFRSYDCHAGVLRDSVEAEYRAVNIIEGTYSCHPMLWDYYDLRIFMTTDGGSQLSRIEKRNGREGIVAFQNRWIPLEESYFAAYQTERRCDMVFYT